MKPTTTATLFFCVRVDVRAESRARGRRRRRRARAQPSAPNTGELQRQSDSPRAWSASHRRQRLRSCGALALKVRDVWHYKSQQSRHFRAKERRRSCGVDHKDTLPLAFICFVSQLRAAKGFRESEQKRYYLITARSSHTFKRRAACFWRGVC